MSDKTRLQQLKEKLKAASDEYFTFANEFALGENGLPKTVRQPYACTRRQVLSRERFVRWMTRSLPEGSHDDNWLNTPFGQ